MDATPILFSGIAGVSSSIALYTSSAPTSAKLVVYLGSAAGIYTTYNLVKRKKRQNAYMLSLVLLVLVFVALKYAKAADQAAVLRALNN